MFYLEIQIYYTYTVGRQKTMWRNFEKLEKREQVNIKNMIFFVYFLKILTE